MEQELIREREKDALIDGDLSLERQAISLSPNIVRLTPSDERQSSLVNP